MGSRTVTNVDGTGAVCRPLRGRPDVPYLLQLTQLIASTLEFGEFTHGRQTPIPP